MFTLRYVIQNSLGGGTASELYSLALTLARFEATADWRRQLRDSTRADDSGTCDDQPAWLLTVWYCWEKRPFRSHTRGMDKAGVGRE